MAANDHFGGTAKSHYSEKQLKKKFIKAVKIPESCKNNEGINICIDFCVTFFAMYYSHLKVMEETDDRISGKLGDTKKNSFGKNIIQEEVSRKRKTILD
jgi:endonuclease IV